jgi:hypothetical protein
MLLSLIFLVALADLVAAGTISQVPRSGLVQCDVLTYPNGPLTMQEEEDGSSPPPPVGLGLANNVLQTNSTPTSFTFQNCTSSYVALDPPDINPDNLTFYFG